MGLPAVDPRPLVQSQPGQVRNYLLHTAVSCYFSSTMAFTVNAETNWCDVGIELNHSVHFTLASHFR